jgi:citronellol/citronellal dehydrogenase
MADGAWTIITQRQTGQNLTDEQVLRSTGVTDFSGYACNPATIDQIQKDFFLD